MLRMYLLSLLIKIKLHSNLLISDWGLNINQLGINNLLYIVEETKSHYSRTKHDSDVNIHIAINLLKLQIQPTRTINSDN